MQITTKTTRTEMKEFLKANFKFLKDKNLAERVSYTLKAKDDKVTKKDLVDLVKEVSKVVDELIEKGKLPKTAEKVEPKAENSVKKKLNKGNKKAEETVPEESESEETAEEPKTKKEAPAKEEKSKKKIGSKKEKPAEEGVKSSETSKKSVQLATMFPETIESEGTKYEIAHDIKTMEDLLKAYEKEEEIVFAYYWSKRLLKQFEYFSGVLGQPKSFPNDLDLATAIYVSDEKKVAYNVSLYTEAVYCILPVDLEEEEGLRLSAGIEYQIYRAVSTEG